MEECHPNCSSGGWSRPPSSSSGVMTRANVKALQALKVMKSYHDFDSTINLESLSTIRERYSIPTKYVLHAPAPGQRSYHPCHSGFSISVDALEAGLMFLLHPIKNQGSYYLIARAGFKVDGTPSNNKDIVNMNLLRGLPKAGGGCSSSGAQTTIVPSLAAAPIAVDPASAHSPSTVQEIPPKEVTRKVPESSGKR
ncbi:hypothetical protein BHE74_00042803 [Ensete ventricosum]|nr:hypothetical protein BHE74_00042803 [Ensete ventricosum]